jgi:choline dehydrogenase-like flavoprotein
MHHICSTCKMGPVSNTLAVVGQDGCVHSLASLRVVDASLLPDCLRATTHVVAMKLGERIADEMRQGSYMYQHGSSRHFLNAWCEIP